MPATRNQLRIIGGQYRGRKLHFPDTEGLRPTPDRVRETLFNWLQPVIGGAHCLDLFAGSGALGLEAISRGAGRVVLVDKHPAVVRQLRDNLALLGAERAEVIQADARSFLDGPREQFEVVFLDPPYQADLLVPCIEQLEQNDWLTAQAWIYVETPANQDLPGLPTNWSAQHSKRAGQVGYHLLRRTVPLA
ncbi:MAG: 16S rRNA (guanine(966)-N(2))-methyltransferase RsmD [Proteobacteria bacterium]|jgi:16S rRNA (guanine966-N2)-methyltransferase|nr:16S rRNA (guanine(966)-N(2))-methyltransferase RsmD [Pseudomonadota bacterium]